MNRKPIVIVIVCMILQGLCTCRAFGGEEEPLSLDYSVGSVYVPAGSAYNVLGLLFWELQLNGGVELGDLYATVRNRKSNRGLTKVTSIFRYPIRAIRIISRGIRRPAFM